MCKGRRGGRDEWENDLLGALGTVNGGQAMEAGPNCNSLVGTAWD